MNTLDKVALSCVVVVLFILLYALAITLFEADAKYHCQADHAGLAATSPFFETTCLPAAKDYN